MCRLIDPSRYHAHNALQDSFKKEGAKIRKRKTDADKRLWADRSRSESHRTTDDCRENVRQRIVRGNVFETTDRRRLCFLDFASASLKRERERRGYFWVDIPPKGRWMVEETNAPPLLLWEEENRKERMGGSGRKGACVSNDVNGVTSVTVSAAAFIDWLCSPFPSTVAVFFHPFPSIL